MPKPNNYKLFIATSRRESREKIRILRIISRMNIGGPAIHVKNLAEGLNAERFCTQLVFGSVSPEEGDMEYILNADKRAVVFIPELQRELSPGKDAIALLKVLKIILSFNPHIIHSHTSKAGVLSRIAACMGNTCRRRKIITVHTFHGNVLDGYFSKVKSFIFLMIEKSLAKVTDRIIAISQSQKKELVDHYKIDRSDKIAIINLGFDLTPFEDAWRLKGKFRQKLGVGSDTILIGIVGRLVPIKNHTLFLDAAKAFLNNPIDVPVKFIIVGDGELRSRLEEYARKAAIIDHVIFCGWVKEITSVYADLDILALTSINEGTPVSIIEAMAASVPVITTGVGGIDDLLGPIESETHASDRFETCAHGLLCADNDPIGFADGFARLIENQPSTMTANAKTFVMDNFSTRQLVDKVERLYETLLNP